MITFWNFVALIFRRMVALKLFFILNRGVMPFVLLSTGSLLVNKTNLDMRTDYIHGENLHLSLQVHPKYLFWFFYLLLLEFVGGISKYQTLIFT